MNAEATHTYGPSAVGEDLRRFVSLTLMLAVTEFRLRYFGSVLGYFWSLARPLMLFGVLYVVFAHVVRFGGDVKHYPVYLLTGIVLWTYFAQATSSAVTSLVNSEGLLRKIRFPRMTVPLSVSLTALFNLGLNLIAVFVFVLISGVEPRASWLQLIPLIFVLVILATGMSMLLAALYVRFRDVAPIWEVALQVGFWASPILYTVTAVPESIQRPTAASPVSSMLTQMRHAFLDPTAPTAAEAIGGAWRLAIPAAIVLIVLAAGIWVFNREAPRIAENL